MHSVRSTTRQGRGTTLAEVIVFSFLMSLLTTAVIAVYVLCMRYMRIAQASADLQSSAQRAMTAMMNDIADTDPVSIVAVTKGISFISPRDGLGNFQNGPTWQAWIGYYIDPNSNLIRKRIALATPATDLSTLGNHGSSPYSTYDMLMAAAGTTELVATNETDLDFTGIGLGTKLVTINGTFSISIFNPNDCQIVISGYKVRPRN